VNAAFYGSQGIAAVGTAIYPSTLMAIQEGGRDVVAYDHYANAVVTDPGCCASAFLNPDFATVPNPPTNIVGDPASQTVVLTWSAPANDGGATIVSYTITSSPGGFSWIGDATTATFTGLTNGTPYTFTIYATNRKGNSTSVVSTPITPADGD